MNLTLTNTGPDAETVAGMTSASVTLGGASRGGVAWTGILEPGEPYDSNEETQVVIIGDKPSVREQIEQGLATAAEAVREMYEAVQERRKPAIAGGLPPLVSVAIQNHGANAVRVILGDGINDVQVPPGATTSCTAPGYLELRELGRLDPSQLDGGRQPSSAA